MERPGEAVAEEALARVPGRARITVVCGGGTNGGDGAVALEVAAARCGSSRRSRRASASGDVVIDALFGTGFTGEPRPGAARLIEAINALGVPVVAVDVPSGVDASTGEVAGRGGRGARTVTFHGARSGSRSRRAASTPARSSSWTSGSSPRDRGTGSSRARCSRSSRARRGDTKYTAGSVLVVGGSPGMTGAVCLAAEAAFRADAGYVTVAAPRESLPVIEARLLEAVKRPLEEVWDAVGRAGALAIGPGLGRDAEQARARPAPARGDRPARRRRRRRAARARAVRARGARPC